MHIKNKMLWFVLISLAVVCLALFLWCILDFPYISNSMADKLVCDIDMGVYPFEIYDDTGLHISSFGIMNGEKVDIEKNIGIGYSSIVNLDIIEKLCSYFQVSSDKELYNKLGQYFSYKNYDETEVCVFFDWYKEPYLLNILIKDGDGFQHITEEFSSQDIIPMAIAFEQDTLYILMRNGTTFYVRAVDCTDFGVTAYAFDVSEYSDFYLYYVESFVVNDNLFVFMNEYVKKDGAANHDVPSGYSGALVFVYDLAEKQLSCKRLSEQRVDFVCRDELRCTWGACTDGEIEIVLGDFEFKEYDRFVVTLDQRNYTILPNSVVLKNEKLYFHVTCIDESQTHYRGKFVSYDITEQKMSEILSYDYEGSVCVKYYRSNSELTIDYVYASSN